jgi:hypothetical protein
LIVGFDVGTAVADQILHWLLFGHGKSEFTILASMSGTLMDEINIIRNFTKFRFRIINSNIFTSLIIYYLLFGSYIKKIG